MLLSLIGSQFMSIEGSTGKLLCFAFIDTNTACLFNSLITTVPTMKSARQKCIYDYISHLGNQMFMATLRKRYFLCLS